MKKLALLSAVAGIALLASGHAWAQEKIKLAFTTPDSLLAFVAKDEGFFDAEGLDVELERIAINNNIVPAMISGSIQVGTISVSSFLRAVEADLDLVAFASASLYKDTDEGRYGLAVRTDSGIEKPEDLIGKKVGNPGIGGILDILFQSWIESHGLDKSKVQSVELAFPNLVDAIASGQLEASVTTQPFLGRMTGDGKAKLLADFSSEIPGEAAVIIFVTTREWADAHPDEMKGLKSAIQKASDLAVSNPQSRLAPVIHYTNLPEPAAKSTLKTNVGSSTLPSAQIEFWLDAMREQGTLEKLDSTQGLIIE